MIEIKDATPDNIPIIQWLTEKTWWPVYSSIISAAQIQYMLDTIYATETLNKVMKDGTQQFIVLYDEQQPRGFAAYGPRPEDHQVIKLHKLYILPDQHGKGYGRMLIEEIKKRIHQQGLRILDLNVNRHNPAYHFYLKIGFNVIREEDIPVGPYWMNDYVMRLLLTKDDV
jgi:ribosomal protein S18 acetylase RimI-like enzyme